jgi:hypothetical protein
MDRTPHPLPEATEAAYWIARAYDLIGDNAAAEQAYREHPWWQSGTPAEQADLVARVALVLIEEERYQEALDVLGSASPELDAVGSFTALRSALRAKVYALLNRLNQSATAAVDAIRLLEGSEPDELVLLARLALVERAIAAREEDLAEATANLDSARDESRILGPAMQVLPFERIEGDLLFAMGDAARALLCYQNALEALLTPLSDADWQREWIPGWDDTDAEIQALIQQSDLRAARRARGLGAELSLRSARAQVVLGNDASAAFDGAIAAARQRNRYSTLFYALVEKAAWLRAGDDAKAIQLLENAADVLEGLRANMRDVELQIGTLTDKEAVYAQLLEYAIRPSSDPAQALRIMERAKSRALLESMSDDDALAAADEDLDRLGQARGLRVAIVHEMRRQMTSGADAESQQRLQIYRDQLSTLYKARYRRRTRHPLPGATPEEVCQLAEPGRAVLHFFCGPRRIFVTPVIAGEIQPPRVLPDITPERVRELVSVLSRDVEGRRRGGSSDGVERTLRPSVGRPARRDAMAASLKDLYVGLIEPLEQQLAGLERLLVIPHGVLHAVPFHGLCRPNGRYLLEDLTIAYAPSTAIARRAARELARPLPSGAPSVGFGVEATVYAGRRLMAVPTEMQALRESLPCVALYENETALRRNLFDLDGVLDVLHFACHGEFDAVDPLLSRLYLTDGPTYAYELLELEARPRLVVLSACETGTAVRRAGDEIFGLVRPFLSRGAGGVVATLWAVADASTTRLMQTMYTQRQKAAHDLPACLRQGQLDLLHSDRYAHPYYWAPFFLVGCHPMLERS